MLKKLMRYLLSLNTIWASFSNTNEPITILVYPLEGKAARTSTTNALSSIFVCCRNWSRYDSVGSFSHFN